MPTPDANFMSGDIHNKLSRAEAFIRKGDWAAADDCFAAAVCDDVSPASRIAFANSLAERERYYDCLCQMTSALDVASISGDRHALSVIYHNLAVVYRELGDYDLAKRFQQCAVLYLDDCGSDELLGLANDAWHSNRRRLAESLAESAVEMAVSIDSSEEDANLAIISGVIDDPRDGIRRLFRVLRKHRQQAAFRLMGVDLLNLSILFGQIGRFQTEIGMVEEAIRCFERVSAQRSSSRARQILSTLVRAQALRSFDPTRN